MKSFLFSFFAIFTFISCYSEEYQFEGVHFLASYMDCEMDALTDLTALEEAMFQAANASGATVLGSSKQIFPPSGLTLVILLSESHASIHTYPEFGACFVDLFTCGTRCSSKKFDEALRNYLKPKEVSVRILKRGKETVENSIE